MSKIEYGFKEPINQDSKNAENKTIARIGKAIKVFCEALINFESNAIKNSTKPNRPVHNQIEMNEL
jgi:hypothetical protein